jgi:hypothetical protein
VQVRVWTVQRRVDPLLARRARWRVFGIDPIEPQQALEL